VSQPSRIILSPAQRAILDRLHAGEILAASFDLRKNLPFYWRQAGDLWACRQEKAASRQAIGRLLYEGLAATKYDKQGYIQIVETQYGKGLFDAGK